MMATMPMAFCRTCWSVCPSAVALSAIKSYGAKLLDQGSSKKLRFRCNGHPHVAFGLQLRLQVLGVAMESARAKLPGLA